MSISEESTYMITAADMLECLRAHQKNEKPEAKGTPVSHGEMATSYVCPRQPSACAAERRSSKESKHR